MYFSNHFQAGNQLFINAGSLSLMKYVKFNGMNKNKRRLSPQAIRRGGKPAATRRELLTNHSVRKKGGRQKPASFERRGVSNG